MSRYLYHLRRRNGRTQTELDIHDGDPLGVGTVVDVVVADETVPARIGRRTLLPLWTALIRSFTFMWMRLISG